MVVVSNYLANKIYYSLQEIEELESKLSEALAYFQDDRETKQQDLKIVQAKKNIADSKEVRQLN